VKRRAGLGLVLLSLVFTIPLYILEGWVVVKLWGWFVVPRFGAHPISIAEGIGLSLIASLVTHEFTPDDESKSVEERTFERLVDSLLMAVLALLFGFVASRFL
jgi:hypothetical protein